MNKQNENGPNQMTQAGQAMMGCSVGIIGLGCGLMVVSIFVVIVLAAVAGAAS